MKTFSAKEKHAAPVLGRTRPYTHVPLGPKRKAQQAQIRRILRSTGAQAKPTIGQPNDQYEQEADRVADQVMAMPDSRLQRQPEAEEEEETVQAKPLANQITPLLQRQEESPEDEEEPVQAKTTSGSAPEVTPEIGSGIQSLRGGGRPLSRSERCFFEPRFGYDFSHVHVHTDSKAVAAAKSVNAKAFTTGKDVVFGSAQYTPQTQEGQRLLAHELTHVVQAEKHPKTRGVIRRKTPAERVMELLQSRKLKKTLPEAAEVATPGMKLIKKVDQAIQSLFGNYIKRKDRFTKPGMVNLLASKKYYQAYEKYALLRGEPQPLDVIRTLLEAQLSKEVKTEASKKMIASFVNEAKRRGAKGLNEKEPWKSTGPALQAWRNWIKILGLETLKQYKMRPKYGMPEAFAPRTEAGKVIGIKALKTSPLLIMSLAHEAIHYYASPIYFKAAQAMAFQAAGPLKPGVSAAEEAKRIAGDPHYKAKRMLLLEGITQYFTLQLWTQGKLKFRLGSTRYDAAVKDVAKLAKKHGEETLRLAYFGGNKAAMKKMGMAVK